MKLRVEIEGCLVLERVSFEAEGVTLLLGPNGAGKTTLLRLLAGVYRCRGCRAYLGGVEICSREPWERMVGYVPQGLSLFRHMRVWENIAYGLLARGFSRREAYEKARMLAEKLGVAHLLERRAWALSGGEAQRVALARALAVEPRLLLLDEAFDHIDAGTRLQLLRMVAEYVYERDAVALIVTHHVADALRAAKPDRIIVLMDGRVVYEGGLEGLRCGERYARVTGCIREARVEACIDSVCIASCCGRRLAVSADRVSNGAVKVYASPAGALEPL